MKPNGRNQARADRIRHTVDLSTVLYQYGYEVQPGTDREQQFRCDLHGSGQDNKPSARLYPESKSFYCYACGKNRDIFGFLRDKAGLSFTQALHQLEKEYDLPQLPWGDEHYDDYGGDGEGNSYAHNAYVKKENEALAKTIDSVGQKQDPEFDPPFETEAPRVRSLLDTFTKEKALPTDRLLKLWEAYDILTYMVGKNLLDSPTAATKMVTLRKRLLSKPETSPETTTAPVAPPRVVTSHLPSL